MSWTISEIMNAMESGGEEEDGTPAGMEAISPGQKIKVYSPLEMLERARLHRELYG